MALKRMKKTPTGWGTGYTNIESIRCEKINGNKLKCNLISSTGDDEELIGTQVALEKVNKVTIYPKETIAKEFLYNTLSCYVDSGVIHCIPEKELK